jgi:hypothetical protein
MTNRAIGAGMTRHKPVEIDCYVRASAALDQVDDFPEAVHEYAGAGLTSTLSTSRPTESVRKTPK